MAKISVIKQPRRNPEADVVKLMCNCDPGAWTFRVTVIDDQVTAECALCLQDYGPFYMTRVALPEPAE